MGNKECHFVEGASIVLETENSTLFPLSEQPLTAFAKLSLYWKRDFAKAEGRKTLNGEGDKRRRRGDGRVKNYTPAKDHWLK